MIRVLAFHIALFLLPFAVYAGYLYFGHRRDPREGESWQGAPKFWLAVIGMVLSIGAMLAFGAFNRGQPEHFDWPEYENRLPEPREDPRESPYINPEPEANETETAD